MKYFEADKETLVVSIKKNSIPPMSAIFNFSCKIILAKIEAIIGVVKLKTIACDKGNL